MCTGEERNLGVSQPVMKAAQDHVSQICDPGGEEALENNSEKLEHLAAAIVCAS